MSLLLIVPFVLMLLAIALLPLIAPHWWEWNLHKALVALALGVPVVMKVPANAPEKATAYRLIAVIVALVLILIFEAVAGVFGA